MAAPRRHHSSPSSSSSPSPHRRKLTRSDRPDSSPVARRDSRVSSHRDRDRDRDRHRRYSSDDDSDSGRYNSKQPRRGGRSSDDARKRESLPPPPPLPPPRRPDVRVSPARDRRRDSDTDSEARERGAVKEARDEGQRRRGGGSFDVDQDRKRPVPGAIAGRKSRAVRSHSSDSGDVTGTAEDGAGGSRKRESLPPPPPLPLRPDARVSPGRDRRRGSGKDTDSEARARSRADMTKDMYGSYSGDVIGTADDGPERRRMLERRKLKQERDSHQREGYETSDDDDGDRVRGNRDRQTGRSHGSSPDARKRDREGRNGGQGTRVKDTRKEEILPPMPLMPSLPPPPPMLNARAGRDSRVSVGEERKYPQGEERRSSGNDSDSEGGERGRGLQEKRGKRRRYSDASSDDEDRRRDNRDRKTARNWRSDNDSSRNGVRDADGAKKREAVKDTRKEEFLPPPPPLPSLPPPPPLPTASAVRDSRVVLRNERRNGDGERRRDGRISSDEDSDSEGGVRGKRSKEERRKRDSSDEDSDSEGHVRGRRSKEERRKRHNSVESDSESHGRRKRSKESRKRQRHRHSDGSSEDDNRRRDKRDRKRERNQRSDEDNEERGQRNGRHSSPRRRKQDRDSRNGDQDLRKREPSPPLPPLPPMPDALAGRTGGIYIPPFRMAQMMREVEDKSSEAYQRLSWDALRKSINGLVNKVNATNIKNIIPELLSENLIRGRGLFCRSCMKSQMASPGFTDVFSALVAVVNTKFPDLGKLLLKRIVLQLKRAYKRNDKPQLLAATKFIAHLVNQQVAHEIIALELLTLLLENPTDDSVEVAVGFVKECGAVLQDLSPKGLYSIFERFRGILHEAELDKRVRYLIEDLFGIRKAKFEGYPAVRPELDLVELEDQFIHEISLEDDDVDPETNLDVFKPNPQFLDDEKAYENLKRNMLGDEPSEEDGSDEAPEDEDEELSEEDEEEKQEIKDETETNLVNLRRTIYLTIMSSVDFEEAGHKLLKIKLEPGQEMELCIMLLECCSQERTYLRYYGLLGQRFCMINRVHQENFETCFVQQYSMIHRLETNKLRNVAKFFAHLLGTSALPWHVLSYIRLTEEDTTSSSRIFIKILFQELSEHLGIRLLNERLNDPTMQDSFESIFPKDNPKNTRFSINFFTSIGLGGITENLREYLKNVPRLIMQQQKPMSDSDKSGSSSSSSPDDSSSGSESDSDSDSDSSSDESERRRRKRRRK